MLLNLARQAKRLQKNSKDDCFVIDVINNSFVMALQTLDKKYGIKVISFDSIQNGEKLHLGKIYRNLMKESKNGSLLNGCD